MSSDLPACTESAPAGPLALWRFAHGAGGRSEPRLREVLASRLGCEPQAVPLEVGPHGRPQWPVGRSPVPSIGFSASHSGDWLLVAVAEGAWPGVDIQAATPRPSALALAQRYFTGAEAERLAALSGAEREACFYRLWVAREAVLKALGRGLAFGLDRLRIDPDPVAPRLEWLDGGQAGDWQLRWLEVPPGYAGAVAWRGAPRALRWMPAPPAAGREAYS